jgi:hypothetical protein
VWAILSDLALDAVTGDDRDPKRRCAQLLLTLQWPSAITPRIAAL